ncbi:DUF6371 domain-containing protein [Flavobacterium sp.]|jgi:hypothetical protein|uniref:DUF6371 domain-containing protein n=1 Tax=Flavobacterium sp. TaxID=239 RepID=UPI0037BEBCE9
MYRYSLDKSSKKHFCPNCKKKTFVKYFDQVTNEYLENSFGRCDRESNCKYHKRPKENNYTIDLPIEIKKSKSTINKNEIAKHGGNFKNNNFIQFLKNHFSNEEIRSIILKYLIGTSTHWDGSTIFWQINNQEEIVTGKVMLFDINLGKRIKKPYSHINWMHKILKLKDYELQQCLFGLHLISTYTGDTIAIVESEKTAVIMSMIVPEHLWLATGSKNNFKKELLYPIKNYKILVFPDKSEFEDWNKRTSELNQIGFKIKCSNLIEGKEVENGYDLADYYIEKRLFSKNEKIYSKAETTVNRLMKINPEILNLIETFDLVDNCYNEIKMR